MDNISGQIIPALDRSWKFSHIDFAKFGENVFFFFLWTFIRKHQVNFDSKAEMHYVGFSEIQFLNLMRKETIDLSIRSWICSTEVGSLLDVNLRLIVNRLEIELINRILGGSPKTNIDLSLVVISMSSNSFIGLIKHGK